MSRRLILMVAFCALWPSLAIAEVDCADWNTPEFFQKAEGKDVKRCIAAGADPEAQTSPYGLTPLHIAAFLGGPDTIKALLDAGANPKARDEQGYTPRELARIRNGEFMDAYQKLSIAGETFTAEERVGRFGLFAECKPLQLFVQKKDRDAAMIDLTEESIQTAAESRLRSARLYSTEADQVLYIDVTVIASAFHIHLKYMKKLFDSLSGERLLAVSWNTGSTGQHAGDSGYILSSLSRYLDEFLVEFLRVNEAACGKR